MSSISPDLFFYRVTVIDSRGRVHKGVRGAYESDWKKARNLFLSQVQRSFPSHKYFECVPVPPDSPEVPDVVRITYSVFTPLKDQHEKFRIVK